MNELKAQHDAMITDKPEGMSDKDFAELVEEHQKESCLFCNDIANDNNPTEGGDMEKTYTKEELDALVAEAVTPIQAELDAIKASQEAEEVDARVAEAQAEADAKVAEIQGQLDASVLEAQAAKQELEDVKSFLAAKQEELELAELYEVRKADRKNKIIEVANFPEDYLESNLDRWCAESDEDFEARLADWKVTSTKANEEDDGKEIDDASIRDTAMNNTRKLDKGDDIKGDLANLFAARNAGINIRTIK